MRIQVLGAGGSFFRWEWADPLKVLVWELDSSCLMEGRETMCGKLTER